MTVSELLAALSTLDPGLNVLIAVHGDFVSAGGVSSAPGASYAVIRGIGKAQYSKRYSVQEDGVMGHLTQLGVSDDQIALVLGRDVQSVRRKKKQLGLPLCGGTSEGRVKPRPKPPIQGGSAMPSDSQPQSGSETPSSEKPDSATLDKWCKDALEIVRLNQLQAPMPVPQTEEELRLSTLD